MNGLVVSNDESIVQFSPDQVLSQVQTIQNLMKSVMQKDQHYGTIPGTPKPTLYKAGAEKLNFTFRLAPKFQITKSDLKDGHREYEIICELFHINTNLFFGAGVGSCSTMEVKYRYRESKRKCPTCGAEAIIKGKQEYGGGWVCFKKQNGCGAKFDDTATVITDQKIGRIENPDLADQYNTVLKMAKKRALVDATITACAASDIFTQDLEEMPKNTVNDAKNGTPKTEDKPPETTTTEQPPPTNDKTEIGEMAVKIKAIIGQIVEREAPEDATNEEKVNRAVEILKEFSMWKDTFASTTEELKKFSLKRLQTIYGKLKKEAEEAEKQGAETEEWGGKGQLPF